ncbi:MAG TPA: hypothetical protein VLX12_12520, partial [Syntrophorhabdales bacterium]|nr:hypothetical protein [Syntrophorhabdales bacterium]
EYLGAIHLSLPLEVPVGGCHGYPVLVSHPSIGCNRFIYTHLYYARPFKKSAEAHALGHE